ncbi:uncharacterized protein [Musca autumnalis]|uniref:uncharacterized protein n=1 Tax=Musca autumnalis TaxID=221902 RepID=UPI003CF247ED
MGLYHETFIVFLAVQALRTPIWGLSANTEFYEEIFKEIVKEQPVESLLILQQNFTTDMRLEIFNEAPIPKVIVSKAQEDFVYGEKFNTELLTTFVMSEKFDKELMKIGANILDYQRQKRIFIVAINVAEEIIFKNVLLEELERQKMKRVLLHFLAENCEATSGLYILKPYPQYRWLNKHPQEKYYPAHWQNMQNKTLITLNGQDPPTGLAYLDEQGNLQMNGYMARLIMLFAKRFNATLKMHYSFEFGKILPYRILNELNFKGDLDIPMSLSYHVDNN